mmetsp:Transcript_32018/g.46146  ORF Transcript_32018/g.46146 Transcript_32018/m.46146 type:complete len:85 (-) Transcript_32018:137-391(-)
MAFRDHLFKVQRATLLLLSNRNYVIECVFTTSFNTGGVKKVVKARKMMARFTEIFLNVFQREWYTLTSNRTDKKMKLIVAIIDS